MEKQNAELTRREQEREALIEQLKTEVSTLMEQKKKDELQKTDLESECEEREKKREVLVSYQRDELNKVLPSKAKREK